MVWCVSYGHDITAAVVAVSGLASNEDAVLLLHAYLAEATKKRRLPPAKICWTCLQPILALYIAKQAAKEIQKILHAAELIFTTCWQCNDGPDIKGYCYSLGEVGEAFGHYRWASALYERVAHTLEHGVSAKFYTTAAVAQRRADPCSYEGYAKCELSYTAALKAKGHFFGSGPFR